MNSKIKSDASDPIKQRNFNLSDSTFKMLTDYADKVGLTNGAALTVILRERFSNEQETRTFVTYPLRSPQSDDSAPITGEEFSLGPVEDRPAIVLPPENVATFKGGKGKHLQAASEQPLDSEELDEDEETREARRARVRRAASERQQSALRGGDIDF